VPGAAADDGVVSSAAAASVQFKPSLKRSLSVNPKDKPIKPRMAFDLRHTSRRAEERHVGTTCTVCGREFADGVTMELHQRNEHGMSRSRAGSSLALNK
jgi:hypothetical protein